MRQNPALIRTVRLQRPTAQLIRWAYSVDICSILLVARLRFPNCSASQASIGKDARVPPAACSSPA